MNVNVPAPTPSPTVAPTPSPTKLPSSSPSLLPSSLPTIDDAPKVIIDQTTSYMESISCEDSFGSIETYFSDITFSDPILEDVTIDYDYQLYLSNVQDKDQILSQVQDILFRNIVKASPLSDSNGEPTGSCREMLGDALNINNVRRLNDFTNVLGWNTLPKDEYDVEGECVSLENVQDVTCFPVKGSFTAQIPAQMEGGSVGLDFNVLGQIKSSMDDPNLFISIEGLNQVQFLGQKSDYEEPRNDPTRPPSTGFFDNLEDKIVSGTGITVICLLTLAFIFGVVLVVVKLKRRNDPRAKFESIQDDAIEIGEAAIDDDMMRPVFTENSPDGVEIVDIGRNETGANPSGNQLDSRTVTTNGTLNLTNMMDRLRGRDDLSYAEESAADDSAFSVETEDYEGKL